MRKTIAFVAFFCLAIPLLFPGTAELLWERQADAETVGSPAFLEGKIIIAVKNGLVLCIDETGAPLWGKNLNSAVLTSPVTGNACVYIAALDGRVIKMNVKGEIIWEAAAGEPLRSSPLLIRGRIIQCGEKGGVVCIDQETGKTLWEKKLDNECFASPVSDGGTVYVPLKNRVLAALTTDGEIKWQFGTEGVIFSSPAVAADGSIYLTCMDHHLYKIRPDGVLKWKFKAGRWIISSPVIDREGNIYFGSYDRSFYSVSKEGALRWTFRGKAPFNAAAAIDSEGNIYTGSSSGHIFGLTPEGKELWNHRTEDFVRRPFFIWPDRNILIVCSLDRYIRAFRTRGRLSTDAQWPKYLRDASNSGRK